MFYEGSLQDGISTAVGQQKLVLCFVTDENNESQQWESEYLVDEALSQVISKAVALRLKAGSEEAGYLAQIFPLPQAPTIVIINNGELREYITPGVSREDFIRRIQTAFSASPQTTQPAATQSPAVTQQDTPNLSPQQTEHLPEQTAQSENVRRILAERAARLQLEKEESERKAKEEYRKGQTKAKADAESGAQTEAATAYKQAELVKKKRQQELEERQRILKRIEDDKAERRLRAAERDKQRIENQKIGDVAAALVNAPESKMPSTTQLSEMTALQVRLFDGLTIRSRFRTSASMKEVRKFVDEKRHDGNLPYTFKQVLTPLPNKNIDSTEENKDLGELGLAPSATLVLIPVSKYTSAYDAGSGGIFSRIMRMIFGFFTSLLILIGLGGERRTENRGSGELVQGATGSQQESQLRNQDNRRRDQQLYNGNSLNFEPRPNEDEK